LGILPSIRFVGFVDDISIIYSRIDLNVLASRSEGMALGILDGFAYEVPAVCTAASGMPEIVIDGKTGILVELDNPDELASALIELLADKETRKKMGQAGRKMVLEGFSYKKRESALAEYFYNLV
jgi:glycosyltransferase involved in cell wall biosynthesis